MAMESWDAGLEALQERLGYRFRDPDLLRLALTHRSWAEEAGQPTLHNERLEFLGDAVVQITVTHRLYAAFPAATEGQLTKMRSALVDRDGLADLGTQPLDLGPVLRIGRGEEKSQGRSKPKLLCNATEALLGAMYLDSGGTAAPMEVVTSWLERRLSVEDPTRMGLDPKSELQNLTMRALRLTPVYAKLSEEGLPHARIYRMSVRIAELFSAEAEGSSKKDGESRAAAKALLWLEEQLAQGHQERLRSALAGGAVPEPAPADIPPTDGAVGAAGGHAGDPVGGLVGPVGGGAAPSLLSPRT